MELHFHFLGEKILIFGLKKMISVEYKTLVLVPKKKIVIGFEKNLSCLQKKKKKFVLKK